MSHENQNQSHERANLQEYMDAYDAIGLEVFTGSQEYQHSTEVFGERWVDGRRILEVAEQPHVDLDEISGRELIERLSKEEATSASVLGIEPGSTITLSFASECDERDEYGCSRFQPGSAILVVITPFSEKGDVERSETRTFGVSVDHTLNPPQAGGTYGRAFDTLKGGDMEDFDLGSMMIRGAMNEDELESGRAFARDTDRAIEAKDTERSMREYLYSDEIQAMALVASRFSS